ncbi:hypothetical protein B9Z19DRAFT_1069489 [Tuber borchii]|uniref:Uncharacterized protein n=1 Tax=Tuber borchii TaxID=42251 RepID=A0A2T6ZBE6_TUBBO|nr:hypothetical protein B9Z19DRAFT_1069489 [Tuber borchii]
MPRLSAARRKQLESARQKIIRVGAEPPVSVKCKREIRILTGRAAGWIGSEDDSSETWTDEDEEFTEGNWTSGNWNRLDDSESEFDIVSNLSDKEVDLEDLEEDKSRAPSNKDIAFSSLGYQEMRDEKSAFDVMQMYYEDSQLGKDPVESGERKGDNREDESRKRYEFGSRRSFFRNKQEARERAKTASECYSIAAMFDRQKALGISIKEEDKKFKYGPVGSSAEYETGEDKDDENATLLFCHREAREEELEDKEWARQPNFIDLPRACLHPDEEYIKKWEKGMRDLHHLLKHKTVLTKHFAKEQPNPATLRRYYMVRSFMWAQELSPDDKRRIIALNVAKSYFRGGYTARQIIKWEREWVENRTIQPSRQGVHERHTVGTLLYDESIILTAREYIAKAGSG